MKYWRRRIVSIFLNIARHPAARGNCPVCWLRTAFWQHVRYDVATYDCVYVCCEYCWTRISQEERLTLAFNAYIKKCGEPPSGEHYQALVQGIWQ